MNHGVTSPLFGIVALNVVAMALFVAVELVELRARRRRRRPAPAEPEPAAGSAIGLERWIREIEEVEDVEKRQAFASDGDFLPQRQRAVNE